MSDETLVPVFMPALAVCLAHAEQVKGASLTESETVRVRDQAICMMMSPERAALLTRERGYRDVNPENCWADWHRLRVQTTGKGYLPKIVLCVAGPPDLEKRCQPILAEAAVEFEFRGRDERLATAFEASAFRFAPSLTTADFEQIASHGSVLYVVSDNFPSHEAAAVSGKFLQLGRRLLDAGGMAMKCESSGIAHGRSRWIELANDANVAPIDLASALRFWFGLFRAFVQGPIQSQRDLYTCGMHLLGKPDLIVALNHLKELPASPGLAAVDLFEAFGLYLLAECSDGSFASGHTFQSERGAPRFQVLWEACGDYEEDDFFFNPFGRWRFANAAK